MSYASFIQNWFKLKLLIQFPKDLASLHASALIGLLSDFNFAVEETYRRKQTQNADPADF